MAKPEEETSVFSVLHIFTYFLVFLVPYCRWVQSVQIIGTVTRIIWLHFCKMCLWARPVELFICNVVHSNTCTRALGNRLNELLGGLEAHSYITLKRAFKIQAHERLDNTKTRHTSMSSCTGSISFMIFSFLFFCLCLDSFGLSLNSKLLYKAISVALIIDSIQNANNKSSSSWFYRLVQKFSLIIYYFCVQRTRFLLKC